MVGTRQMNQLLGQAKTAGARVVLVGDEKQLQPIEAGGAFRAIGEKVGRVEMKEIQRQRDKKDIEAIHNVVGGRAESALLSYAKRGLLKVTDSREEAMDKLVADYRKEGLADTSTRLIITGTRSEAGILNQKVQAARKEEGHLGDISTVVEQQKIHVHDRVMITRRSPIYRVENGDVGTVTNIDKVRGLMTVNIDGEKPRRVHLPYQSFTDIRLGYAATTHKFQGATSEKCYVLAGGDMQDRELSYVQLSRARGETRLYIEKSEVEDTVVELSRRMDNSRQKDLAVEVQQRQPERAMERELTLER
jgi:ATP-dependent exoDNAse (exonuclease V) alpha subunit